MVKPKTSSKSISPSQISSSSSSSPSTTVTSTTSFTATSSTSTTVSASSSSPKSTSEMNEVKCLKKEKKLSCREKKAAKQEEIRMLLNRLKQLVPSMSPDKKLSKFEIIQNVIQYINELQSQLESQQQSFPTNQHPLLSNRQPLGLLSSSLN